jgi:predicted lipoprotein with Yx(FWY)xxD motif
MRAPNLASTLAIGAVALGVAACGSGSNSSDSSGSSASTGSSSRGGVVSVEKVGGMQVLADAAGKTLYTASAEKGGTIRCVDACTSFWSPALATPAAAKQAATKLGTKLSVVTRPDGKQQLTFDGRPLYSFTQEGANALKGNGFSDDFQGTHFQWQAAATSGGSAGAASTGASSGGTTSTGGRSYGY